MTRKLIKIVNRLIFRTCRTPYFFVWVPLFCVACGPSSWNNPYPYQESDELVYYDSFSERPKHLDPVSSYSSNEYVFLGQIYEPPLQYHFLKRPYELIPLTATHLPTATYLDKNGEELSEDSKSEDIDRVRYKISIKPGILFQPHPAFAKDENNNYLYHDLDIADLKNVNTLSDFDNTGTRELLASDYIYQIKRMAHPRIHSPIAGLMEKYIFELDKFSITLKDIYKNKSDKRFLNLNDYSLSGVKLIDKHTFEIVLKEKYPQFLYWLSMSFFSPIPWEADLFYSQKGLVEKNISLDWYPVGTGPFMLTENNPNRRMVLERNPNFRGESFPIDGEDIDLNIGLLEDAGKKMPFIDKAIYSLEKESIPAWNKFLQGYYDTSGIVSDSFDQAIQFSAQGDAQLTDEMQQKGIKLLKTSDYLSIYNDRASEAIDGHVCKSCDRAKR